jgi:hypothetical protein
VRDLEKISADLGAGTPDRSSAVVSVSCTSKTVAIEPHDGTIYFAKRLGKIEAFVEDPRQQALFAEQEPASPNQQ